MNTSILTIAFVSIVFAFLEYLNHKDYQQKHPDYDRLGSFVFGFIIIALIAIFTSF